MAFLSSLWSIKPESGERVVQMLWGVILATWSPFSGPGSDAYTMAIKETFITGDTRRDGFKFEIMRFGGLVQASLMSTRRSRPSRSTRGGRHG